MKLKYSLKRSIHFYLKRDRMSQTELACMLDKSRQHLNLIMRHNSTSFNTLEKICEIFNVQLSEFFKVGEKDE